ncbi:membrane protein insertase YidC [uncultured Desulfobacter sp.]|uniref:membrane protein insertase YidC n=1 Tax=uncultured Desulfobacter sp. TaxID=240139 RepID=UPI0029F45A8A|nr:membrane protein insertase YidC [uncultured Desulfobacter sp.]
MDEQKRLFLAVALSVVVLLGYQFFFAPAPQPNNQKQDTPLQTMNSPESDAAQISDFTPATVPAPAPTSQTNLRDFRTITLSTPYYTIAVNEHKAAVTSLTLNDYKETNDEGAPAKQLVAKELADLTGGIFAIDTAQSSIRGLADAVFSSDANSTDISLNQGEKNITFSWTNPDGITVKKVLTFRADSYLIHCDIIIQNGSNMPVSDGISISVPGFFNDEIKSRSRFAYEGPVAYLDNKFITIKPKDIVDKDTYSGIVGWAGYTSRYFLTAVMPDNSEDATLKLSFANEVVTNRLVTQMPRLDPEKQNQQSFTLYMGPKSHKILSQYDNLLKKSVNFGFFDIIAKPLLIAMNFIHDIIPNYGVAIILLTIFIKLIFWPLGTKSYKSMNEMKKVQPLMMEIREKYKDDKQRMNQEIMGLYKTYKVNPASGCLPLLVQMPIFFALYRMLYMAIELRHAPFVGWIQDLSGPDRLFHFNFAIPFMDAPYGIPVLTLLMGASFLLQQKMTPTAGDPMQAKMMMLMPIFMTVLFINFPAGLVLYMFVNNIISMGQQYYTQKILA